MLTALGRSVVVVIAVRVFVVAVITTVVAVVRPVVVAAVILRIIVVGLIDWRSGSGHGQSQEAEEQKGANNLKIHFFLSCFSEKMKTIYVFDILSL